MEKRGERREKGGERREERGERSEKKKSKVNISGKKSML